MDRRQFLSVAAAGGAAVAAAPGPALAELQSGAADWPAVKRAFSLRQDAVHMAGFFLASHPAPVKAAIERHRAGLDRDPHGYHEANVATLEMATRSAAARYLATDPDQFALTDSTTMGLGLVYTGMKLDPGDEIVTDTHDHRVTYLSTQYAADRSGADVRRVALYDDPATVTPGGILSRLQGGLSDRTRLLALTWVHSGTGVKLPVRAIGDLVASVNRSRRPERRLIFALDGVHGFGIEDVTIADLGCDAFIAGCHKWILGPRGTGVVWASPDVWPLIRPTIPSFDAWRAAGRGDMPHAFSNTPGGFHSFEHRWALAEAFAFHQALGKQRVAARIHALNRRCKEALVKLPRVRVATPLADELSAGIICFHVAGYSPAQIVAALHRQGVIASVTPGFYKPSYARLAPSLLTLEEDVDRAVAAVARL